MGSKQKINNIGILPSLFFIVGFSLALHALSPGLGWGESPAVALAAITLKRASFFGYPLFEMFSYLLSRVLPFSNNVFSLNILGPILYGLVISLIYSISKKISGSALTSCAAAIGVILYAPFFSFFTSLSPASWSFFLIASSIAAYDSFSATGKTRSFLILILLAGLSIFHSGAALIVSVSAFAAAIIENKSLREKPAYLWAAPSAVLMALIGTLIFVFLRPPLIVDFVSSLPPWLGTISPIDNLGDRIFNPGDFRQILSNFIAIAKIMSGPLFLFFLSWIVVTIFQKKSDSVKYFRLLPVPIFLMMLFSTGDSFSFYKTIFAFLFIVTGIPTIFKITGTKDNSPLPSILAVVAVFPLVYFSFWTTVHEHYFPDKASANDYLKTIRRDESIYSGTEKITYTETYITARNGKKRRDIVWTGNLSKPKILSLNATGSELYFTTLLKGMRRDSILVADPVPDNMYTLDFYNKYYGLRKDIDVVFTKLIMSKEYREHMWKKESSMAKIPDREEYAKLLGQVATMAKQPGVITQSNRVRERIIQGMTDLLNDAILIQNSSSRSIYYNRIDNIINSQMYDLMYFDPSSFSFRLLIYRPVPFGIERFVEMATSSVTRDPIGKEIVATYFRNIGEHFYSQDKPGSAVPFLETCISLNTDDISCRFFLGLIYKSWGKFEDAELNLSKALENILKKKRSTGQDSGDILMLARIFRELGNDNEAVKYEKMVEPGALAAPPNMQK